MRGWQSARSKARAAGAASSDAVLALPTWPPVAPVAVLPEPPVEMTEMGEMAEMGEMTAAPAETPTVARLGIQPEVLRLLEVVTNMCDHVIEYIEADRRERRLMIDTLAQLSRVISDRKLDSGQARVHGSGDASDIAAILDRVDPNTIVDRLDLDEIVAGVDLDAVVARIDLEAIVKRVDPMR